VASDFWDLIYPVGDMIKDSTINENKYKNGEYYKKGD